MSHPTVMPQASAPPAPHAAGTLVPPPIEDGSFAPRPTRRTVGMRTFIPWQIIRFAVINLRMLVVIAKSHD